jgi:hypothetical protein
MPPLDILAEPIFAGIGGGPYHARPHMKFF